MPTAVDGVRKPFPVINTHRVSSSFIQIHDQPPTLANFYQEIKKAGRNVAAVNHFRFGHFSFPTHENRGKQIRSLSSCYRKKIAGFKTTMNIGPAIFSRTRYTSTKFAESFYYFWSSAFGRKK